MNWMNQTRTALIGGICVAILSISGCQTAEEQQTNPTQYNANGSPRTDNPWERVNREQTQPPTENGTTSGQNQKREAHRVADRLAALAARTPNVNDATAVVIGPWAVVGIDVDAKLDRSRVGTIKYTVAQALREDPEGAGAVVTADPDIVQRLREIRTSINRGEPAEGFFEELGEIVGRMMPQYPRHVENETEAPQEKQTLDAGKENEDGPNPDMDKATLR